MGYLSGRCEPAAIQHRKVSTENSKNDMIVEGQVQLSNLRLFHHFSASATGKWQRFRKLSASLRCCKGILTTSVLELHPASVNLQETFLDLYKLVQATKARKVPKVPKQPRFTP